MALHAGSGRSIAKALQDNVDYLENPLKTDDGELVTGYECDPRLADEQFMLSKREYITATGRSQDKHDVIAYHLRQSFKPGEVTPEEANRIGVELAMRFTKGRHAFIVATHIDKSHIHNHICFNSTTLDCKHKFRNFHFSAFAVRRISDLLCAENSLSVVQDPKPSPGKDYGEWLGDNRTPSAAELVRRGIDSALERKPATFEGFLALIEAAGFAVKRGAHVKFTAPGFTKGTRCDTLRGNYTEEAIRERIAGRRAAPAGRSVDATKKPGLLIDIQAKMREGKGAGYERWAKVHNLKQMAQTLIYLQEHGMDDYDALAEKTAAATARFNDLSDKMKSLDERLAANAALQKNIVNYSKTRAVYVEYRKAGYSKKFKELHEADILIHQTAKKAFDELGLKKIPTVASLRADYAPLLEEKRNTYREYTEARSEMRELLIAKSNVDRLLNITDSRPEREQTEQNL
jgi:hypothetical protein